MVDIAVSVRNVLQNIGSHGLDVDCLRNSSQRERDFKADRHNGADVDILLRHIKTLLSNLQMVLIKWKIAESECTLTIRHRFLDITRDRISDFDFRSANDRATRIDDYSFNSAASHRLCR